MKRLCNILCALLLLGTMTSCEDWLDVDPKSEVKSDVMFQSVSGFKDALTGIYLLMSDQDLYGREATWGFVDALAQQTDVRGGEASTWYNATRYNYSATTTSSNGIWSKSYNIIANVNFLLENLAGANISFFFSRFSFIPSFNALKNSPFFLKKSSQA